MKVSKSKVNYATGRPNPVSSKNGSKEMATIGTENTTGEIPS